MKNLRTLFVLFLCIPFMLTAQKLSKEDVLSQQRLAEQQRAEEIALELQTPFAEKHHFGINIELNSAIASTTFNDLASVGLDDRLNDVRTDSGTGISIGILYGYELNKLLSLRTQAIISSVKTRYLYDLKENNLRVADRETVNLEFPIHLVLENLDKVVSPAAVLGARYRYDIAQNTLSSELAGTFIGHDVLLDAGFGLGFQVADFRVKTELLYSRGLVNQIGEKEPNDLGNALNTSFTNQLSLRLLFTL